MAAASASVVLRHTRLAGSSQQGALAAWRLLPQRQMHQQQRSHGAPFTSSAQSRRFSFEASHSKIMRRPTLRSASQPDSLSRLYISPFAAANAGRSISLWPFGGGGGGGGGAKTPEQETEAVLPTPAETSVLESTTPATPTPELLSSESVASAQEAATYASEQVQTLADMGQLSGWFNVRYAQWLLDWLVEATGLPWWATIALVTLSVRVLVLPLVLVGQGNAIRLANINPEMQAYMKDIKYAKDVGDQKLLVKSVTATQKLMKDNNCHPFKSLIAPLVQMPLFITFFFALRGLAEAGLPSLQSGGLAWFTDLTIYDPYVVLPILSAGVTLAVLETGAELGTAGTVDTPQQRTVRNVLRIVTVLVIPFIYKMPAAVFCYWITNGFISLSQLLILQLPFIRRVLNLPQRKQHAPETFQQKGKPMGFWDSVAAGKTSQTTPASVRVARAGGRSQQRQLRDEAPSVLQEQRRVDASRERALEKLQSGNALAGVSKKRHHHHHHR